MTAVRFGSVLIALAMGMPTAVAETVGTVVVRDIDKDGSSSPHHLTTFGSDLFFVANDGVHGDQPWVSDGTRRGTHLFKDIMQPGSSIPPHMASLGNTLLISATATDNRESLWASDGTAEGTVQIQSWNVHSNNNFTQCSGSMFFSRSSELWQTDGTVSGTGVVGSISSGIAWLVSMGDEMLIFADQWTGAKGVEIWKASCADGEIALVSDLAEKDLFIVKMRPVKIGGNVFFHSRGELWVTDGSASRTLPLWQEGSKVFPLRDYARHRDWLFFSISGSELWRSDGTQKGTSMVRNMEPPGGINVNDPVWLTSCGNYLMFSTPTERTGYELWRSDGTRAGTKRVKDIWRDGGSDPQQLTCLGEELYFSAKRSRTGRELWRSDGTRSGTVLVDDVYTGRPSSHPSLMMRAGGITYFVADDDAGVELRKLR